MGRFEKDRTSKEIILNFDKKTKKAVDEDGRMVNPAGYLIDAKSNIINKEGKVVFNFWEVLYNEPPKLFSFTEFSLEWITGDLDPSNLPPYDDLTTDLQGRPINTLGYLIDKHNSIIDQRGRVVFTTDVLTNVNGVDSQLPEVFRQGFLSTPQNLAHLNPASWNIPGAIEFPNYKQYRQGSPVKEDLPKLPRIVK